MKDICVVCFSYDTTTTIVIIIIIIIIIMIMIMIKMYNLDLHQNWVLVLAFVWRLHHNSAS